MNHKPFEVVEEYVLWGFLFGINFPVPTSASELCDRCPEPENLQKLHPKACGSQIEVDQPLQAMAEGFCNQTTGTHQDPGHKLMSKTGPDKPHESWGRLRMNLKFGSSSLP